jgi:hypothetical protein
VAGEPRKDSTPCAVIAVASHPNVAKPVGEGKIEKILEALPPRAMLPAMDGKSDEAAFRPVSEWLAERFEAIRAATAVCAERAARRACPAGATPLLDAADFLHSVTAALLECADTRYPDPVSQEECSGIVCAWMLNVASNERRKSLRRRRILRDMAAGTLSHDPRHRGRNPGRTDAPGTGPA